MKQVEIIQENSTYGFRLRDSKAVVYATGESLDDAFVNAYPSLIYEAKQDRPSIVDVRSETIREYQVPKPTPTFIHLTADRTHAYLANEPAVFKLSAIIYDQYKQEIDVEVEWEGADDGILTATQQGEYVVTAKVGDLKRSITLQVEKYVEPEVSGNIEEKVARLEKESLITMAALADKHEETLQLKKMNEELRQTTLIALEGVAILNEEVQQIKKNSEASAN